MLSVPTFALAALPWELAPTRPTAVRFAEHPGTPRVALPDGTTKATYYSDPISLLPGEVVFTDPARTRIELPEGDNCLTGVSADIVDAAHEPVPLDEVYMHHWIFLNKEHPNDGVCGGFLK